MSDGTMAGTKSAKAEDLGTRIVHPDTYELLLRHLQPAELRPYVSGLASASRFAQTEVPLTVLSAVTEPGAEAGRDSRRPGGDSPLGRENGWVVGDRGRLGSRCPTRPRPPIMTTFRS